MPLPPGPAERQNILEQKVGRQDLTSSSPSGNQRNGLE